MAVVTLTGFRPSPRFDGVIWDRARIEESVDGSTGWTTIQSFTLSPVDTDATQPQVRNFTTNAATLDVGYYRVVFLDPDDNEQASGAIYSAGIRPTAVDLRSWSKLDYDALEWSIEDGVDPLDRLVNWAIDWVTIRTGAALDAELEAKYVSIYHMAVQMLIEWTVTRSQPDFIEDNADFDMIQSFTAGEYSETRRSLGASMALLHPFPPLNELLGFLSGQGANSGDSPMVGAAPIDWERQRYIIDAWKTGRPYWYDMRNGGAPWIGGYTLGW